MYPSVIRTPFGELKARFEVQIQEQDSVYMSFTLHRHMADHSAIVIVEAKKFIDLWRNDPEGYEADKAFGNLRSWRADRKFSDAQRGFSHGIKNPVPVAYVSFNFFERESTEYKFKWFGKRIISESLPYVTFTNGITRTIWLLANRCPAFPIECKLPAARQLHEIAGLSEHPVYMVDDLIGKYRPEQFSKDEL